MKNFIFLILANIFAIECFAQQNEWVLEPKLKSRPIFDCYYDVNSQQILYVVMETFNLPNKIKIDDSDLEINGLILSLEKKQTILHRFDTNEIVLDIKDDYILTSKFSDQGLKNYLLYLIKNDVLSFVGSFVFNECCGRYWLYEDGIVILNNEFELYGNEYVLLDNKMNLVKRIEIESGFSQSCMARYNDKFYIAYKGENGLEWRLRESSMTKEDAFIEIPLYFENDNLVDIYSDKSGLSLITNQYYYSYSNLLQEKFKTKIDFPFGKIFYNTDTNQVLFESEGRIVKLDKTSGEKSDIFNFASIYYGSKYKYTNPKEIVFLDFVLDDTNMFYFQNIATNEIQYFELNKKNQLLNAKSASITRNFNHIGFKRLGKKIFLK